AQGRANLAAGLKGPVRGTSILTPAFAAAALGQAAVPAAPCRIELEPAHLTLIDRGETASLMVRILNRPADVLPRLVLADASLDSAALAAAVTVLLAPGLKRSAEHAQGGWEVWRTELALQLEPEARRLLWERSQGGPLEVDCRVEVPGKAAAELLLGLLC